MGFAEMIGAFGSSFCPENTQIELACAGPCVGLPLPVISPANAAVAVPPTSANVHTAVAIVALRSIASPWFWCRGSEMDPPQGESPAPRASLQPRARE
jgi:hypothetical protein